MDKELYKQIKGKEEIWKPVKGYEGLYEVSNTGRVFSIKRNIVMEPSITRPSIKWIAKTKSKPSPYFKISLMDNNKKTDYKIHRLVAEAFLENPENKPVVNHLNHITTDNRVQNLEWCTYTENSRYSSKIRKKRKLKEDMVLKEEPNGQLLLSHPDFCKEFLKEKPKV